MKQKTKDLVNKRLAELGVELNTAKINLNSITKAFNEISEKKEHFENLVAELNLENSDLTEDLK